ncbi:hypothetical protein F2Q69_00001402 [Brassica cretica]|uniref:Uncharacterized protein n=1 Tax=Brassica cretica TaxID=69181 RepID=A0A8S9NSV5_BRACR|nr:hypothetical protein F2Q69_00001402 [Brassica cretica]
MDDTNRLRRLRSHKHTKFIRHNSEEVTSIKWEFINMTEQEEDLISRMYRLVEVTSIKWEFINMTEQEEDLISRMYRLVGNR